jgi:hypothetical protein
MEDMDVDMEEADMEEADMEEADMEEADMEEEADMDMEEEEADHGVAHGFGSHYMNLPSTQIHINSTRVHKAYKRLLYRSSNATATSGSTTRYTADSF